MTELCWSQFNNYFIMVITTLCQQFPDFSPARSSQNKRNVRLATFHQVWATQMPNQVIQAHTHTHPKHICKTTQGIYFSL